MRLWVYSALFLQILANFGYNVFAKYIEGHLQTFEDWKFLTRFCFLSDRGRLEFEFEYPKQWEPQNILLYYDEADQWPAVYKSGKNCSAKLSYLKPLNNQILYLSSNSYWSGCKQIGAPAEPRVSCNESRSFRSSRARWWFVAVSKCGSCEGLNLKYKIWMTNGNDLFYKHFSADEFYILQVDIAFLFLELLLLVISIYIAACLRERQLLHSTYKIYMVSLTFEVLQLLFMCIGYGNYANNGLDSVLYGLKTFARILESVSVLTFLLMLILMAKGFTITRGRISVSGSIKIAVFMTLYVITYAVLFIYESSFFDPGEVLYIYESPPGYGLIALRLLGWAWFCYAIFFTLKHYPEKSKFYFPFFAFYTIWFFFLVPIMVLVSSFVLQRHYRATVVNAVTVAIRVVDFLIFMILTRPSAANSNFPYHVRTSQIGVMNNAPQMASQNGVPMTACKETESFSSSPYAVSEPDHVVNGAPNFANLFVVSNTRSATNQQNGTVENGNQYVNSNAGHRYPHENPQENPFIVSR